MKLKDLGEINTAVALFGGPYSNLQATTAMLRRVADGGLAAICTGDVVAYCADPVLTIEAIRAAPVEVIAGNCEQQLATNAPGCGCGFTAGSTCDLLSAKWYAHANGAVRAQDRAWMASLPDMIVFTQANRRFAVIHGGATDVSRFLWPTSPEVEFVEEIQAIEATAGPIDAVIAGHCGIGFQRQVGRIAWINAGVIGMPANNGLHSTQFAVLEGGAAVLHDLHYEVADAHAAMTRAGLTQGYHDALLTGYWPSEDVLPPELRRSVAASG